MSAVFSTAPFSATIKKAELYQDPHDPGLKKLLASIDFSHMVDPATLAANIQLLPGKGLSYRDPSATRFSLKVDKDSLHAHLFSAPLAMPLESVPITLRLGKANRLPERSLFSSPAQSKQNRQGSRPLPTQFFRYPNSGTSTTPQGEPQQVLTLASSFPSSGRRDWQAYPSLVITTEKAAMAPPEHK